MNRWRLILVAVVVLGLGGALIWAQVRGDDRPPVVNDDPTPSPSASPTPTPQVLAPPDLTGEDFTRIVADIVSFLDELSENPDPDRVGEVYAKRCACYESRRKALSELRERGYRYVDAHTQVLGVERVRGVGQTNRAVLDVVLREGATVVVDGDGEVVETLEADPPTRFTMVLVRPSPKDAWRVTSLVRHGPVEGEV